MVEDAKIRRSRVSEIGFDSRQETDIGSVRVWGEYLGSEKVTSECAMFTDWIVPGNHGMEFGAVSAIPTSLAAGSSRILVGMNFDCRLMSRARGNRRFGHLPGVNQAQCDGFCLAIANRNIFFPLRENAVSRSSHIVVVAGQL